MISAAAQTWNVPEAECTAASATVTHKGEQPQARLQGSRREGRERCRRRISRRVTLKDAKDYKIIGQPLTGVDNPLIVTGKPLFGIDVKVPGMLYATYVKCPVFGGKAVSANLDEIKKEPGIKQAFIVEPSDNVRALRGGVAILGDHTWAVFSARKKLKVQWDEGPTAAQSDKSFAAKAEELSKQPPAALAAQGRRRRRGARGQRHEGRRGQLLLSVHLARDARAAERDRALQGRRQGRSVGADAESCAGARAHREDVRRAGQRHHHPHDAHRRRLRPAPRERLHRGSGGDREAGGEHSRQADVDA